MSYLQTAYDYTQIGGRSGLWARGLTEKTVDISAGTSTDPIEILFQPDLESYTSVNFYCERGATITPYVTADILAEVASPRSWVELLVSPHTLIINPTGYIEIYQGSWSKLRITAYPDNVSGTTNISYWLMTRNQS